MISVDQLEAESKAWRETAEQSQRNANFYRELVERIARRFGKPAYTSDDGSVQQDVLCIKVPELVSGLEDERNLLRDLVNAIYQDLGDGGEVSPSTYAKMIRALGKPEMGKA